MSSADPSGQPEGGVVLTAREKLAVGSIYVVILAATIAAFALLFAISAEYPSKVSVSNAGLTASTFGAVGIIAYLLGLRHGVDADHIAAIDNTTRKLLQDGKRPLTVGTWFSLGHSTVVVAMVVGLIFAAKAIASQIPAFREIGGVLGTLISGTFLWLIGIINAIIVLEIYRIFRGLRQGRFNNAQLDEQLNKRGFMNRYFGRLFGVIRTPRQMYPVGVLFGLGFDTASEVLLIAIAVALGSQSAIPIYAVLLLPALFLLGMTVVDTTDGITMRFAYGWAFLKPIRKIYYNLTITVISVLVATLVGTVEILQVLTGKLGLNGILWNAINAIDLTWFGILIVGIFVGAWGISVAYYRYKRFDELGGPPPTRVGLGN